MADFIKKKFGRYGLQEWAVAFLGFVTLAIQVYRYATDTLGENGVEIVVFCAAVLLMFSPLTILNIVRKARGIDTK